MAEDDRVARGMATALELFKPGSPVSAPSFQYPKEIAQDWSRHSMGTVMGDVWGRPGLDKKQRALITIALLTAIDKPEQLRAYVTGGLNLGLSREEICEAIFHVSVYAGFPAAIQGLGIANEVFEAFDAADDGVALVDLKGQNALVLGALGRAGQAVARKLCEEGAAVVISARREEEGQALADGLSAEGLQASFVLADVTERSQVAAAVDATVERLGRIDILVNCISYDHMRRFMDDEERFWDKVLAVNYKGAMLAWQEALRHMIPQRYGRILTLVSDSAKIGATLETAQSGAKGAIVASSKSLAREMARHEVTVNAVCLGPTSETAEPPPGLSQEGWASFMRLIPFRRPARPAEVASLVAYLAMPEASFITGQAISVSGGLTMS